jgi:hypothetical protein
MPKFDDINVGDELPTLTRRPVTPQLVTRHDRALV